MKTPLLLIGVLVLLGNACAQKESRNSENTDGGLSFYIGKEVVNAQDYPEKEIIQLWKDYLNEGKYRDPNSPYWSFENLKSPDHYLWGLEVPRLNNFRFPLQWKILGVFPVENDHYALKSALMHVDDDGEIHLNAIPTVYAKEYNGKFLLVSSPEYQKSVLPHKKIGNINYYIDHAHEFDLDEAQKMDAFNSCIARKLNMPPIEFDYFVANTSKDIIQIWGYDYLGRMYRPDQTGGVAIGVDKMILAGNNSEYYPHELMHLYSYELTSASTHPLIEEGFATFFGGSGGYPYKWHLKELKTFLAENPDFDLSNIDSLSFTDIPNGKHKTDFQYVIGAFLMAQVHEKHGISGVIEALEITKDTNHDSFFIFIEDNLGVRREDFEVYRKMK